MMEEVSGGRRENNGTPRKAYHKGPVKQTEEYPDGEVGAMAVVLAGWDFKP